MNKKLFVSALVLFVAGFFMIVGGIGGMMFTYQSIVAEDITTPADASIPTAPVRGPLTLMAQATAIRHHVLATTDNKVYAQMPRTVTKLDEAGNPVLDEAGKEVQIPNALRASWFNPLTLITSLNLGILTYAFALLSIVLGFLFMVNGYVFLALRKN